VQGHVRNHVEPGSTVNTDAYMSYAGLHTDYAHKVIDHAEKYVDGQIHTNGCENFWSLLKRSIKGTYVSVEPFHRSGISMSRHFGSTTARAAMRIALSRRSRR
jgi:hypothetical protein